jgi:hypothetical protein
MYHDARGEAEMTISTILVPVDFSHYAADAKHNRALAQGDAERLRTEAREHSDVEMNVIVEHGSPAQEIISFSRKAGFDIVVMGHPWPDRPPKNLDGKCSRGRRASSALPGPDDSSSPRRVSDLVTRPKARSIGKLMTRRGRASPAVET